MSLSSGQKLGHYEILELIGQGGMGVVYRAKDSKLGRDVAIKVLPDEFAQDQQRLKRFKREAKVLASLNHPNIAAIYGLERSGSIHFLVLELVDGETLAERIARGAVPLDETLEIASKIADALEDAHEHGIVHRDLKPPNVKITPHDEIKVLDFGLAKAFAEETPEADSSMSPTLTRDATSVGVILGTAAYMSPEQARGKHVDKRTDIFAFGSVLYEMLTGKKAFAGDDVSEVLAAVIKLEPDWHALPNNFPRRLSELLHRCLEKDPKKRRRDIGDVRNDMMNLEAGTDEVSPRENAPSWRVAAMSAFAAAVVVGALGWGLRPPSSAPETVFRFSIAAESIMGGAAGQALSISPGARRIVYSSGTGGLYLREMDALHEHVIPGTEHVRAPEPFFSPDGTWVGFYAGGRLQKISVRGGEPITICETDAPIGVSWGQDDVIVYGQGSKGIHRVSGVGGEPEVLVEVEEENGEFALGPQMLPDGKTILFTLRRSGDIDEAQIVAQSLESGRRTILVSGGRDARYVPPGYLVYGRGNTLMAAAFDPGRLEVEGAPVPAVSGVQTRTSGLMRYSVSSDGTLIYGPRQLGTVTAMWVDRSGAIAPLSMRARRYVRPRISGDGRQIVSIIDDDLWIYEIERELWSRLTSTGDVSRVAWAPDGKSVVFSSSRNGVDNLYRQSVDAAGAAEQLTRGTVNEHVDSVSPDGRTIVFHDHAPRGVTDLWLLSLDGSGEPQPLLRTEFNDRTAQFSPSGDWIAYTSDERGGTDIYLRRVDGTAEKVLVSPGNAPVWSPDGRELFFVNEGDLRVVDVSAEGSVRVGLSRLVFDVTEYYISSGPIPNYDITPDGKKFFVLRGDGSYRGDVIEVVVNWRQEMNQLLAAVN